MGDAWFEIAMPGHFWLERRFEVLKRLCPTALQNVKRAVEVGCGTGGVQAQFEEHLGIPVDGIDLNPVTLEKNVTSSGRLYCYDVLERNTALAGVHDLVLLLDVIEHVPNDADFLDASAYLLGEGGFLIVNVPASRRLHSDYDDAAGHLRRYHPDELKKIAGPLHLVEWTYWGLPLVPAALARKWFVHGEPDAVIRKGFQPPGDWANRMLAAAAALERIPQHWFGTSLMAVFRKVGR